MFFVYCTQLLAIYFADEAMEALKEIGIEEYSFRTGELWAYVGQKRKGHGEQIAIHRSYDNVLLETGICLGKNVLPFEYQGALIMTPISCRTLCE